MAKISENSRKVFECVKNAEAGVKLYPWVIAEETGLNVKQVNGAVTAWVKKEVLERVPGIVHMPDGTSKKASYVICKNPDYDIDAANSAEAVAED